MKKLIIILSIILACSVMFNIFQWRQYSDIKVGFGQYDLPCLYSTDERTVSAGEGSALRCDVNGKVIIKN